MQLKYKLSTAAQSIIVNTIGFSVQTNCHSIILDNVSDEDNVLIYFNNDEANSYLLKKGTAVSLKTDNPDELLADTIKIVFSSTTSPHINILKQTKTLIT